MKETKKILNLLTINTNGSRADANVISPVSRSRQIRESGISDDSPPGITFLNVGGASSNERTPPGSTSKKVCDTSSYESKATKQTLQKVVDDCKAAQVVDPII